MRKRKNPKEEFRKSDEWLDFRKKIAESFANKDPITGKRLAKGFNVHHMRTNQDLEGYCDLSKEDEFVPLNRYTHKLLHYLFTYYKKDKDILDRVKDALDRMCELANDATTTIPKHNIEYVEEKQTRTQGEETAKETRASGGEQAGI
jgi:hypothetical protein